MPELTSRQLMISIVVVLLIALNAWRWWPESIAVSSGADVRSRDDIRIDEMKLTNFMQQSSKEIGLKRNLFIPVSVKKKYRRPVVNKNKLKKAEVAVVKISGQDTDLNAFKLEGVLDNGGKMQAFLSKKDQVYMVYEGEKFATRYAVERITLDGILLQDKTKGISKWIGLGGE